MSATSLACMQIQGGVPLRGTIPIYGAKNAALPLMVLSLLTDQEIRLDSMPFLEDIKTMGKLLTNLGTQITHTHKSYGLTTPQVLSSKASYDFVRRMRASIMVLGALVGRMGQAQVSLPGGCAIGVRPINYHLEGLQALGVQVELEHGYIVAKAPHSGIPGGVYTFPKPSLTGTLNLLFAAVLAKGASRIENVAMEPEIGNVIEALIKMGACIQGQGTSCLEIEGKAMLGGAQQTILPDRIEMGTFMIAAAMTGGKILLDNADLSLLPTEMALLRSIGMEIEEPSDGLIRVVSQGELSPFSAKTAPYPGFATDLQAQFMALATLLPGRSVIRETIWENRFMHVAELVRMGALITLEGDCAIIQGRTGLMGAQVMATDLRASVALILAGLAAHGTTTVRRIYHLDRGYERIEERLSACGARMMRLDKEPTQDI